jgi:pimeloyl-ACP methyl ester carboxylesterase
MVGRQVVTLAAVALLALRSAVSVGASTDHYFDSAEVQIHYIEDGTGEPVVLVHGFMGSIESWIRLGIFGELAKSYRVIALDSRGHGKSGKPHNPQQYEREMGLDIVRLLDHLNIQRAHIIGYSLGALIVAQLATARPERFLSATFGGAARVGSWSDEDEQRAIIEAAEMERGSLRHILRRLAAAKAPEPTDEQIQSASAQMLAGQDAAALAAILRSERQFFRAPGEMRAIRVPTLALVGSNDPYLTEFRKLKEAMPQSKLLVIEEASHATAPSQPQFIQALLRFLRDPLSAR